MGLEVEKAGLPIVNVPGCPVQPDNFMETILYLLYQVSGLAPMIPLDDQLRPMWLFGKTVHEGCDRLWLLRAGRFRELRLSPKCIVKLGCWGPVVNYQCPQTRMDGGYRRMPQRRRNLHRLHHARVPRQIHTFHGRAARRKTFLGRRLHVCGRAIRALRSFTNETVNKEPKWRHPRAELTTGYRPTLSK